MKRNESIEKFRAAHIGIIGFGRGGQSLARWWQGRAAKITVSDRRSADAIDFSADDHPSVRFQFDDPQLKLPQDWDALCISGGIPNEHPYIQAALARSLPITNDAQIFIEHCPARVIGITGSAGKTTTTSLIGEMLRAAGDRVWVGGNIGRVLLDDLPRMQPHDHVVMELSSFQLEWMRSSPGIATILNLTPNHLDRHGSMEAYIEAKHHIMKWQRADDWVVLSADDVHCRKLASRARGQLRWFGMQPIDRDGAYLFAEQLCLFEDQERIPLLHREEIPLRGKHNWANALAACAVARIAGVELAAMVQAIRSFQPVAYRLQPIRNLDGVSYVNDSIATSPERVIAAIASYDEPLILLLGGQDKDLPWRPLLERITTQVRSVILFGEAAPMIQREWRRLAKDVPPLYRLSGLAEATRCAKQLAQAGDVVLLSPGGTSYDAYRNFEARGQHFHELVMSL